MSGRPPEHPAIARLAEVTFLLVKLECGGASDPGPAAALLKELAAAEGLDPGAADRLGRAAERLTTAVGGDEGAIQAAVRAAGRLVDDAADAAADGANGAGSAESADDAGEAAPADAAVDPEMLDSFVVEALEFLGSAEQAALDLDAGSADPEAVDTLFRCFHTLKGTAGFLDLPAVVALAHRAESLLSVIRDAERAAAPEEIELILRSVDTLSELVGAVRTDEGAAAVEWRELAGALDAAAGGDGGSALWPADSGPVPVPGTAEPAELAQAPKRSGDARESAGASDWTRVRTDVLDRLIDGLGELMVAQSILNEDPAMVEAGHSPLAQKAWAASKIVRDLQTAALSMRTVPLAGLFRKTARLVRELSRSREVDIALELEGEDTQIDRNMVDLLGDPLVHMIRNAVDHGIESRAERRSAGKPEEGRLRLRATNEGSEVVLELSDDGRGMDRGRIHARAIERGLVAEDAELTDAELLRLIFVPGFSTATEVTDLSGRGVGMDVVRSNIEALHGRIEIHSEPGAGTVLTIRVPLTLAITDGLLVRVGGERYIVPSRHVLLSFRPEAAALGALRGQGERVRLRDDELPIVRLHEVLGVSGAEADPTAAVLVVVATAVGRRALLADEVIAQIQVVAKPLGPVLDSVRWLTGGAILGDGRVGLVLDVPSIAAVVDDPADHARELAGAS